MSDGTETELGYVEIVGMFREGVKTLSYLLEEYEKDRIPDNEVYLMVREKLPQMWSNAEERVEELQSRVLDGSVDVFEGANEGERHWKVNEIIKVYNETEIALLDMEEERPLEDEFGTTVTEERKRNDPDFEAKIEYIEKAVKDT